MQEESDESPMFCWQLSLAEKLSTVTMPHFRIQGGGASGTDRSLLEVRGGVLHQSLLLFQHKSKSMNISKHCTSFSEVPPIGGD